MNDLSQYRLAKVSPDNPLAYTWFRNQPFVPLVAMNRAHCESVRGRDILEWGNLGNTDDLEKAVERFGTAYSEAGRGAEAVVVLEEIYLDTKEVLGRDHVWTFRAGDWLLHAYAYLERWADAIPLLEASVAHNESTYARYGLGQAYLKVGRREDAKAVFEKLLPDVIRHVGPDHPNVKAIEQAVDSV